MKYLKSEKIKEQEKWILEREESYRYMLLSRMKQDCEYFLGYGNRYEGHLWALRVEDQIHYMRFILDSFSDDEKPDWITAEKIGQFEKEMLAGERIRDTFYSNQGDKACYKDCFGYLGYMTMDSVKKIKKKKEAYEKELGTEYDLYDSDNQYKEGYIEAAGRLIEYYKECTSEEA